MYYYWNCFNIFGSFHFLFLVVQFAESNTSFLLPKTVLFDERIRLSTITCN